MKVNKSDKSLFDEEIVLSIMEDLKESQVEIEELNKELKRKAEASETKYKAIYDSSADAIMVLEPPTWKFTSGNLATIKMFKVKDEKEFVALGPWDVSPEKQPDGKLSSEEAKKMITKAMKEGSIFFEWTHKRINDGEFPATVLLSKMKLNGKEVLQAVVRDITIRKEAEQKIKDANKSLLEVDALKGKFLTVTSHELKTPLTPAKIQAQMLLEGDLGELNEKQHKSFDIILRNINRLDGLISDILEISKLQESGFKLTFRKTNIKKCVDSVMISLVPVAKKKGVILSYVGKGVPSVPLDKERIEGVLTNLVGNAIKFTDAGSIKVIVEKKNNDVLVRVVDTGVGISKENVKKLFKPFYQVEPMYTRKHGGTGLGLSIAAAIIKRHGGKLGIKSTLRKGSEFYFTLPIGKLGKKVVKKEVIKDG